MKNVPPGPKLEDSIVNNLPFLKLGNFKIAITPRAFFRLGYDYEAADQQTLILTWPISEI
jgi:hypothetical protein